jgi:hypothetical protein
MATIDTSIYGNIKPVQIEDPINRFARQQEASVNALKMQEMQQSVQDRNMLRQLDPSDPDYLNKVSRVNPKLGAELGKSRLETDEKRLKMAGDSTKFYMDALPGITTPQQMAELTTAQYNDPNLGPILKRVRPLDQSLAAIPTDPKGFEAYKQKVAMGMKDFYGKTVLSADAKAMAAATAQETEFNKKLGGGQAEAILKSRDAAEDAAAILQTNQVGKQILDSGAITGAGAEFFVGLNQALKTAGIDFGYGDASANSQAYAAAMGQNTAKLIKQFGAGTGLSDADRVYAEKIAAGKITMDETAIRKILDINDRAARNVISNHNKKVEGVKTNIPLKVNVPREVARQGKVTSGPNQGKTVIEYTDGTREYK